jgi:drug/metabolite transporter (DMT)-like permease
VSVIMALAASFTYGVADFVGGLLGRREPILAVVLWSQAVGLVLALGAAALVGQESVAPADFAWGAAGGLAGTAGIFFLYKGLAEGRMAVVSPVAALVGAIVPLGIGLALGERPAGHDWLGIGLAMPAIWLVTAARVEEFDRVGGARFGALAGAGFGLFFAAIAQTGSGSGLWPLVGARVAQVTLVAVLVAAQHVPFPSSGSRWALIGVGVGDILANVFLLIAFRSGLLTVVSVLASLYPAVTVVLAVLVLGESIHRRQRVGLVLAMTAVGLIAA